MFNPYIVTRRTVLVGGLSVALVGCDQGGGGVTGSSGGSTSPISWPSWTQVGTLLTIGMVAGPIGGTLAGAIGLPMLTTVFEGIGVWAGRAHQIYDLVNSLNETRAERFAPPASDSQPRPFVVAENGNINDFDSVPLFRNDVAVQFGVQKKEDGTFGEHDIYATVKRLDEPAPRTLSEVWGSGDLPQAIISPSANGNWDGSLTIGALPPGAYVSYSWKVPRGQRPSDDEIANGAFIGPAFLAIDDASYSTDLSEAVEADKNVQARFQLPDANMG